MLNGIVAVGAMTEAEDEALAVVEGLRERLKALEDIVIGRRDGGLLPPRLVVLDPGDPPLTAGAGFPSRSGARAAGSCWARTAWGSRQTTWAAVHDVDPEVLVLVPGGCRCRRRSGRGRPRRAPRAGRTCGGRREDRASSSTAGRSCRPGPRVVDGMEILAELIDPAAFVGIAPPASWARAR